MFLTRRFKIGWRKVMVVGIIGRISVAFELKRQRMISNGENAD